MDLRELCFTHCPGKESYESFWLQERFEIRVYVLEEDIIRVVFLQNGTLALHRTWTVCPDQDIPWEGRDRLDVSGFSLPSYQLETFKNRTVIETSKLRMDIDHIGFRVSWYARCNNNWVLFTRDRKTQSYNFGQWGQGIYHYLQRELTEQYFGFGEKCGNMDRAGRRFRMLNLDAMGYDAETTDPLYKHIPFYLTRDRKKKVAFGLFYDNLATCEFDMGQELDNYHGYYRYYCAQEGDLDYYMILGPTIQAVVKRFAWLTGPTTFGPKWSLGYSGSTMSYTDAPNAQELLQNFLQECDAHEIPCGSFQLSSGYTSINGKRCVFNWNTDKIPDPLAMTARFHEHGVKLCANIKPCLLTDNPLFPEAKAQGLFIRSHETEEPQIAQFWDGVGAYLDFTNPHTVDWWKQQINIKLLAYGIDATWNDNNEFEIWNGKARCYGFGQEIPIVLIRPLQALLMIKASFEAQQEAHPEKRPYLISRSGCPGMQHYVQTWSGDNRTSWNTLRYNVRMGKGLSLSGIFNFGHDVGGFAGDAPEPELFVRWVQNGIFHPRFTIHSWNDDGTTNLPWMYPDMLPLIRAQFEFRYRLMPYLYTLLYRASEYDEPVIRPTFYDFEHDASTFEENDDFMLGPSLLVASVVEKGQREREVYLPSGPGGWYEFHSGTWFQSGQTISVPAPLDYCPLFVREGGIVPLNNGKLHSPNACEEREFRVFPHTGVGEARYELFEDDGESWGYKKGYYTLIRLHLVSEEQQIPLHLETQGEYPLPYQTISFWFPPLEKRRLLVNGKQCDLSQTDIPLIIDLKNGKSVIPIQF
jgi:alpha-glucosidase